MGLRAPNETGKPTYWYTCCEKSDVEQTLEAGQTFELHWLAERELPLPTPTQHYVTLSLAMFGPYVDPFSYVADSVVRTLNAPDVIADTWEAQAPVSSIVLPNDLPNGLYWFRTGIIIEPETRGEAASGMGVIRVGKS